MRFTDRLKHSWNAFLGRDPTDFRDYGQSSSVSPTRTSQYHYISGGSIIEDIKNRIAVDCSQLEIKHVMLDEQKRFKDEINSGLNNCLTLEANIDQSCSAFIQDVVYSMLDEGTVAVFPYETDIDPTNDNAFDVLSMRTAKILQWYPKHVKIEIYNEFTGKRVEKIVPKSSTAIIENPFYVSMNTPNSTVQRLKRKLALLDKLDTENGSGKLDMIIQFPYAIKTESQRKLADNRVKAIEEQLMNHRYGIAYADSTERIIQLNRAVENNLLPQIQYLTDEVFLKLSVPKAVFEGTADEAIMLNYTTTIISPIMSAIALEFKRKFLSKTARTRGHSINLFNNPFKVVPAKQVAEIANTFIRNEVLTANEIRGIVGYKPADDPKADKLRNPNMPDLDAEQNNAKNGKEAVEKFKDEEVK